MVPEEGIPLLFCSGRSRWNGSAEHRLVFLETQQPDTTTPERTEPAEQPETNPETRQSTTINRIGQRFSGMTSQIRGLEERLTPEEEQRRRQVASGILEGYNGKNLQDPTVRLQLATDLMRARLPIPSNLDQAVANRGATMDVHSDLASRARDIITVAVLFRRATTQRLRSTTNQPESRESRESTPNNPAVAQVLGATRVDVANILDPQRSAERREALNSEIANAQNRLNLSPAEYHNRLIMQNGAAETDQNFCRALLSPPGDDKTLVIMTGGNNERLTQQRDRNGSLRGQDYLYNRFAQDQRANTDVLQFRVGQFQSSDPGQQNAVASIHIQNIVNDALQGQGMFQGRRYTRVRMFGYSYGAGHNVEHASLLNQRRSNGEQIPEIDRTVSVDGIQFQSIPPRAVTQAPAAGQHMHVFQRGPGIRGNAVNAAGNNVQQREIAGTNHRNINDANLQRPLFDNIYQHLTA